MNETIPRTPDRGSGYDDENSYVPETPQSGASPRTYNGIPIPSLTRIRRSLGVIDNSPPQETPSLRQCCGEKSARKASRLDDCSENNLHLFRKVRVSLFHDKPRENENTFCINTKAFYGSNGAGDDGMRLAKPVVVKPVATQGTKRKRSRSLYSFASVKQSIKRHKAGEINCGVGHGIRKPKTNKSSSSVKSEKKKSSPKQVDILKDENNKKLEEADSENEKIEVYDPSKKFFKYKTITRSKAKLIDAIENVENVSNSTSEKLDTDEDENCDTIANSPVSKSKSYTNQSNLSEYTTTSLLKELRTSIRSNGKDFSNLSINKSNTLDKNESDLLNYLKFIENDKTEQTSCLQNDNFSIVETEKSTSAYQNNIDYLLNILQGNLTENVVIDESTKSNMDSIKDKQNKGEIDKCNEFLQSKVVNESQYLMNTKEDDFNAVECKECQEYNLMYEFSNKNNKDIHLKYHNSFQNFKFQEWENHRLVFDNTVTSTKVILIKSNHYMLHKTKLEQILNLIAEEISINDRVNLINNNNNKAYLLVKHDIVVSILISGIKIIQDNILSKPKVMFGVDFIWTAKSLRRQKIASKLLDVMRSNFDDDYIIEIDQIAFSKNFLTSDGKAFATSYTKSSFFKVF